MFRVVVVSRCLMLVLLLFSLDVVIFFLGFIVRFGFISVLVFVCFVVVIA